jgi:ASC-1-like (ASCH) protein
MFIVKPETFAPQEKTWQQDLMLHLELAIKSDPTKSPFAASFAQGCGVHLAVLVEPYLSLILEGKKTVESRFSQSRQPPYERVAADDILILKRSSGPIQGICRVTDVWFYELDPNTWFEIERFAQALCMDESPFWENKRQASYATLMRVSSVVSIPFLNIAKLDPRGWVTLRQHSPQNQGDLFRCEHS